MTGPSLQQQVEEFEARDLDRRTGIAQKLRVGVIKGPPEPRTRRCHNCEQTVALNDNWECPTPGCERWDGKPTQVFRTTEKVDCDACGAPAWRMWQMNEPGPIHCECKETPAQRRSREARERKAQFEAAKLNQHLSDARHARECWRGMNENCQVKKQPFAFCHACIRNGGKFQGMLRQHEMRGRESFREIELEVIDD